MPISKIPPALIDSTLVTDVVADTSRTKITYTDGSHKELPAFMTDNFIINGDFSVWQRGTNNNYWSNYGTLRPIADRWFIEDGGSVTRIGATYSSDKPPATSSFFTATGCLRITCEASSGTLNSTDRARLIYTMEGYDFSRIFLKECTLGFWVKTNKPGTYTISFSNHFEVNPRIKVIEYIVTALDEWEFIQVPIDFDDLVGVWNVTNQIGLVIQWGFCTGPNYINPSVGGWSDGGFAGTFGSDNLTNFCADEDNYFQLSHVKLEEGTQATQFVPYGRTHQNQLLACYRYFQTSYGENSFPGDSFNIDSANEEDATSGAVNFIATSNHKIMGNASFITEMRTKPSIIIYDPYAGNQGMVSRWDYNHQLGISYIQNVSRHNLTTVSKLATDAETFTTGDTYKLHYTASAELI